MWVKAGGRKGRMAGRAACNVQRYHTRLTAHRAPRTLPGQRLLIVIESNVRLVEERYEEVEGEVAVG